MNNRHSFAKLSLACSAVILLIFAGHVVAQGCVQPPEGMISWWTGDFDGSDVKDGNDGVLTNGAQAGVAGQVDGAFSFDGTDDFVQLPFDSGIFNDQFTVDAWAFPEKVTEYSYGQGVLNNDFWSNRGMALAFYSGASPPTPNPFKINGFFHNTGGTMFSLNALSIPNQWHHVAMTYDGKLFCLYQDGVQEACTAADGNVRGNNLNFRIGHDQHDGFSQQRYFQGLIDEVEIFNRALSADEILAIYNAGSEGKCKDQDEDGVPDVLDVCPDTAIPESAPTRRLGVNRWALGAGDGVFDTTLPRGGGPSISFTIEETGGCSCEQIIEALNLGKGHEKFGCSISAMEAWVDLVNP